MVRGSKRVVLHHPSDAAFLYPSGDRNAKSVFSMVDARLDAATLAERFPDASRASPVAAIVEAGDVLYIPAGWWHDVRGAPGHNVSLNYWYRLAAEKRSPAALVALFADTYAAKRPLR